MKDAMRDLLRCPDGICQVFNSEPCLWFRPLSSKLKCNTNLEVLCCDENQIQAS
jgi:hypothetical protein